MREILAHATAKSQYFIHRRPDGGGAAIVVELGEDAAREVLHSAEEWTAGGEGGGGVLSERRANANGGRFENKLASLKRLRRVARGGFRAHLFPSGR